jgi:hypothetical protein
MKRFILIALMIFIIPTYLPAYTHTDTAKSVVKSLDNEPEKWRHDQYKLYYFKHPTMFELTKKSYWESKADCVIWIANGFYGVEIQSPKRVKFDRKTQKYIWNKYQLWANAHFAKVFEDDEPNNTVSSITVGGKKVDIVKAQSDLKPLTQKTKPTVSEHETDFTIYIYGAIILLILLIILFAVMYRHHTGLSFFKSILNQFTIKLSERN